MVYELLLGLAGIASVAASAISGDVPAAHESEWTACRNEKGDVSYGDEIKGCEALIAAADVDNEIKAIAHTNRGTMMAIASFFVTAKDEYDRAIKLNSKLAPAYYSRALLQNRLGDPSSALKDYGLAIQLNPKMIEAYVNRGIIYATLGKLSEALTDFDSVVSLEPGNPDNYRNRAALLRDMGRTNQAEADLAKAKSIDPSGKE